MNKKTVLISGASRGIGRAAALPGRECHGDRKIQPNPLRSKKAYSRHRDISAIGVNTHIIS